MTVSSEKQESLSFFQKKGFEIVNEFDGQDLYKVGEREFLLVKKVK